MDGTKRIERALETAMAHASGTRSGTPHAVVTTSPGQPGAGARPETGTAPPKLSAALRHAVFPGGARVRPHLCLAVAQACGEDHPALTDAAAAAIELLHCASLVHDDLPCFDDADTRRGRPSVHCAYGQPLAVLAGDSLIVLAFETLARAGVDAPARLVPLLLTVGGAVGMPHGISAGQAWESETDVALETYQRAKTGALFVAATAAGAASAGADPAPWRALGDWLGEAYQVADDIRDLAGDDQEGGKPLGQDAIHGRPNAVMALGLDGAMARLRDLVEHAVESIPTACSGADSLRDLVKLQATRLVPKKLSQSAA